MICKNVVKIKLLRCLSENDQAQIGGASSDLNCPLGYCMLSQFKHF
jgi:hypothetical protein